MVVFVGLDNQMLFIILIRIFWLDMCVNLLRTNIGHWALADLDLSATSGDWYRQNF